MPIPDGRRPVAPSIPRRRGVLEGLWWQRARRPDEASSAALTKPWSAWRPSGGEGHVGAPRRLEPRARRPGPSAGMGGVRADEGVGGAGHQRAPRLRPRRRWRGPGVHGHGLGLRAHGPSRVGWRLPPNPRLPGAQLTVIPHHFALRRITARSTRPDDFSETRVKRRLF